MSVGQNAGLPPTRIISWQQLVLDADPDWYPRYQRPWIYEWSNGRRHYQSLPYPNTIVNGGFLVDDNGVLILQNAQALWVGVSPGGFYSNGGVVSIDGNTSVGLTYSHEAVPIFLRGLDDTILWSNIESQWLPNVDPTSYLQLWNNNGEVNISLWQLPLTGTPLGNDGGVVTINSLQASYWPNSAISAWTGFYNNGNTITIKGFASYGYGAPIYFQGLDDITLLLHVDALGLPSSDPQVIGQLWNNGGELAISLWTKMGGQWIASASFGGVGNAIITGFKLQSVVVLGGVGTFTAAGSAVAIESAAATLGGVGGFTSANSATAIQSAIATLAGSAGLSGLANAKLSGPASMGGQGAFVGHPTPLGSMNGAGAFFPIENAIQSAIATPSGSGSLSGTASEIESAAAAFSGVGNLTRYANQFAIAAPFGTGGLSGIANEIQSAVATFSGSGGLT